MNQNIFNMKEKIPLYIVAAFVLFLLATALAGCRTKTVTEYMAVHDTTYSVTRDTVTKIKTEYSHDTLRIETEKVVTVNVAGDTVKVVEVRDRWRDRWNVRTDTVYKAKTDTIYKVTEAAREKQTVTKRPLWERLWVFAVVLAVCTAVTFYYKNRK